MPLELAEAPTLVITIIASGLRPRASQMMKIAILSAVCASAGALLLPAGLHGHGRTIMPPHHPRASLVASASPGRVAGQAAAAAAASLVVLLSGEVRADAGSLMSPIAQFKLADGTNVADKADALKGLLKVPERDPAADAAAKAKYEEALKARAIAMEEAKVRLAASQKEAEERAARLAVERAEAEEARAADAAARREAADAREAAAAS